MDPNYRQLLAIPKNRLDAVNATLLDPNSKVVGAFLQVVAKYGTPDEINRKHSDSRQLSALLTKVETRCASFMAQAGLQ